MESIKGQKKEIESGGEDGSRVRSYEVLYYKRTNKVHKSKGVSKLDGILTIQAPPSCVVTLKMEDIDDDNEEESDEENAKGKTKKWKRKKTSSKLKKNNIEWTGIERTIAKRVFGDISESKGKEADEDNGVGLNVDDVVVLPQLECQIVSVVSPPAKQLAVGASSQSKAASQLLQPKKQPLVSRGMKKSNTKTITRRFPLSGGAKKGGATISSVNTANWQSLRSPPRQPIRQQPQATKTQVETYLSDKENYLSTTRSPSLHRDTTNTTSKPKGVVNSLLNRSRTSKRRKLTSTAVVPVKNHHTAEISQTSDFFEGAIGNIVVPPSVRTLLRPHQRVGITFLWNCLTGASPALQQAAKESCGCASNALKGCILADEMGLGKTLMTISTIFALHRRRKGHRFIVVCPSSLVSNWGKEFDKWLGRASQPKRVVIRKGGEQGLAAIRAFVAEKPNQSEVLIVSYDLFRLNASLLTPAKKIGLLVVDEGHRLKNTSGSLTLSALNALHCEARLLITGTPIQNSLSEFYNVANFVRPGLLGDLPSFRRVYERPISAANNKNATWEEKRRGQEQSRELETITKTFMLRRLQKDVLKSLLPARSEFLLFCRPSQEQCAMYKTMTSNSVNATGFVGASSEALTLLTNLRKLCAHPALLTDKSHEGEEDIHLSGKFVVLESLLMSIRACNPDDKVVIVSNFTSVLSIIEQLIVSKKKWSFNRLDGTTDPSDRQSLVDSFNRSSSQQSFIFMLSSKAGGCGLNLIGANRLIMVDADWNPATDMQAMARIYRQGQTKPCFVYRFFLSGTVEEVVYQRQTQKGNLARLTVDGSSKSSKGSTKEELRDCFTLKEGCACDTKRKVGNHWPDYDGAADLQTVQNCSDEPLLAVAEEQPEKLAFVHVVTDAVEDTSAFEENQDMKQAPCDFESNGDGSDEEYEFEG